ncbi:hypothetical protein N0V90_009234 [Kalmusia sp. IMI 367209]|nr:hypothetical protein N0V90_009234 [Kalmusia sp. IMI 367209]
MALTAEKVLQKAAEDGSLDAADWPDALKYILDRLDEIVADFPKPPHNASSPVPHTPSRQQTQGSSQESQAGDKENAAPKTPSRPSVPAFALANSDSPDLPPETITFYSSIRNALSTNFSKGAPHTIQRLAELVLEPKRRYRYLSPYLRALDRVVSVSSSNTVFPLPQAVLPTATGLLNGATSTASSQASSLGSDESLGGALLTPIPWLQNRGQNELISESTEMVDGPNGTGRIETVTVAMLTGGNGSNGAQATSPSSSNGVSQIASSHPDGETLPSTGPVTQGEILRQEQEAGVVLNNPHSLTSNPNRISVGDMEGGGTVIETVEGEEEVPHARGPDVIGMEDTGPQRSTHLDIEGAVGRPSIERSSRSPQPITEPKDEEMKDEDSKQKAGADAVAKEDKDGDEEMKNDD